MHRFEKFKTHFLWKRKKEILLYMCILIAVLGAIKITATIINRNNIEDVSVQQTWSTNCYRVYVNNQDLGLVATREEGETAVKQAIRNLTTELGYDPEATPKIRYYEEYSKDKDFAPLTTLVPEMQQAIKDGIDVIKVKAYAMKIGDDFVVALGSEEAIKEVLQNAQNRFVSGDSQFAVTLNKDEYNSLVETPNVIPVQESLSQNRSFATAPNSDTSIVNSDNVDSATNEEQLSGEESASDSENQGKTISVGFAQDVMIVQTFVDESKILSIDEATELITKENEQPKKYAVQSGDCASIIASKNEMSLQDLYEMNPGIDDGTVLQIGDELTVTVPEPELSVQTKEEIVYPEAIPRETSYVENPDKFVGSNTVVKNGSDGVKQVTATLTKVDGKEISREVTNEEVVTQPIDKVVEKGTKPLPAKGATGDFIYPLVDYTITSPFGARWGGFHYGVDLAAPIGTSIRASDGGVVTLAGWNGSYGLCVIIDHGDGVTTRYGHMSKVEVEVGQQVSQYEEIGKVGSTGDSTGPHCHFEIRFDGTAVNPLSYLSD